MNTKTSNYDATQRHNAGSKQRILGNLRRRSKFATWKSKAETMAWISQAEKSLPPKEERYFQMFVFNWTVTKTHNTWVLSLLLVKFVHATWGTQNPKLWNLPKSTHLRRMCLWYLLLVHLTIPGLSLHVFVLPSDTVLNIQNTLSVGWNKMPMKN